MKSIALLKKLERLEAKKPRFKLPTFLELLAEDAKDLTHSQARREAQVYTTLTLDEKREVHRREIERLTAQSPGIDEKLSGQFIVNEREMLEQLESEALKREREKQKAEKEGKEGEKEEEGGKEGDTRASLDEISPGRLIWTSNADLAAYRGYDQYEGEERSGEPRRVF